MKFSKRAYPILELIENKTFSNVDIQSSFTDEINEFLHENKNGQEWFEYVRKRFLEIENSIPHICYFASGIFQKAQLLVSKLFDIFPEIPKSEGIYLLPDKSAIIYRWNNLKMETIHIGGVDIIEIANLRFEELDGKRYAAIQRVPELGITEDGKKFNVSKHQQEGTIIPWITLIYLAFYHFAEVEVKIISSATSQKKIVLNSEKYLNETKPKIEIVDSNWFTKIIRIVGFSVSGHFRLQPHGQNLSKRKLIWIDEYQKDGFTRKEKIKQT